MANLCVFFMAYSILLNSAHVSTTNDPENQLLGLSTIIKIPIDGVEVETCLAVSHELYCV